MTRPRIEDVEVPASASDGDVPTVDTGVLVYAPPAGGAPSGAAGGVLSGTYPNPGFAADMATQAELDAHVNDTADAHDASAISFSPTGTIAATDVQAAIAEVASEASGGSAHIIEDSSGTDMTARTHLQFTGATVTDDGANNRTLVAITAGGSSSMDDLTTFDAANGSPLASATDYEFDAASTSTVPTGWAALNSAPYRELGGMGMVKALQASGWNAKGIFRTPPSETTWTLYAKFSGNAWDSDFYAMGLFLRDSSGGKLSGIARSYINPSVTPGFARIDLTSATSFSAANALLDGIGPVFLQPWYMKLKKNSATSYDVSFSVDCITWTSLQTGWNPQTFIGAAPNSIGFLVNDEYSRSAGIACHWWRARA